MARPNRSAERRRTLLPEIARAFAELGYRRATTAELARRCRVRENILYRLWPDKKAMFVACIDYMYDLSREVWRELRPGTPAGTSAAEHLLAYEADHHGELGFYRIVFAGLSEADDAEIRVHLRRMYRRFQGFVARRIREHRAAHRAPGAPGAESSAWAFIGLGTVAHVCREFGLLSAAARSRMIRDVGRVLLQGERA
jgi:AcrR family transcriptional regulator